MAIGTLAKIGGKSRLVSNFAGRVIKGADACGIFRTGNGFAHRLTKFYPGPNATLTESIKTLKDGRVITQKLWSWPDGSMRVLTRKSDGFFSSVARNAEGKVTDKLISHNGSHLIQKGTYPVAGSGSKYRLMPYENYVNGGNIARFKDGVLYSAQHSTTSAEYFVKDAIKNAEHSFRCIG